MKQLLNKILDYLSTSTVELLLTVTAELRTTMTLSTVLIAH